jgi:hypothetical protein
MAYNIKYKIQYKTFHGKPLIVQIRKDEYSGDINRYLGNGFSHVKVDFEDVDFWDPVKPSNATLQILATQNGQYNEFRDAKDRDYLVEIIDPKGTEIKKRGSFTLNSLSSKVREYPKADIGEALRDVFNWNLDRHWTPSYYLTKYCDNRGQQAIAISTDGSKMYTDLYYNDTWGIAQYNLSTAYDIGSAPCTPDKFLSTRLRPTGIHFKPDGTKIFISIWDTGDNSDHGIEQFDLTTAWDLSTASNNKYTSTSFGVADLGLKSDGTKLYILEKNNLREYDLSTAWDVTSKSQVNTHSFNHNAEAFEISPDDQYIYIGLDYFVDGEYQGRIWQYYLSTAGDTTTIDDNYTMSFFLRNDYPIYENPGDNTVIQAQGLSFYDNGRRLAVIGRTGIGYWYLLDYYDSGIDNATDFNSLTLQLYDSSDNFIENIVYIIKNNGNDYYDSGDAAINDLLYYAKEQNSEYEAEDDDSDDLLDVLIYKAGVSNSNKLKIRVDVDPDSTEDQYFPGYSDDFYGNAQFSGGHEGAILKLQSDENGLVIDLATFEMLENTTKQDVIDSCIEQINNNYTDYSASSNPDNPYKIDILYTGSLAASDVTLQVSLGQDNPYWDATANGITEYEEETEQILWTGFNIGGLYSEEYINAQYVVEIKATDGLADLKAEKWPFETGGISLIKAISKILQHTGLKININSAHDIYEDNFDQTATDDPLSQIFIDKESVVKKPYIETLQEKLRGFKILQDKNEWWIVRQDNSNSYDYRKFDYQGNFVSYGTYNPIINIGTHGDYINNNYGININRSGIHELDAGNKSFIIKQSYGLKDQLLKDPTMALTINGQLKYWESNDHSIYSINEEDYIKVFGTNGEKKYMQQSIFDLRGTEFELKFDIEIQEITDITSLNYETVPRATGVPLTNTSDETPYLDISGIENVEFLKKNLIVKLIDTLDYVDYTYITEIKSDKAYLAKSDIDDTHERKIFVANIYIEGLVKMDSIYFYNGEELEPTGNDGAQRFEIISELALNSYPEKKSKTFSMSYGKTNVYDALIRIYQGFNINYVISKMTFEPQGNFSKGNKKEKFYPDALENYKDEKKEIEFFIGDLPENYDNAGRLFINGFFRDKERTILTSNWNTGQKYIDIVSTRMIEQMALNGFILSGEFLFPNFVDFKHVLSDTITGKNYVVRSMTIDYTYQSVDAEWEEIERGDPGTLETTTKIYENDPTGTALYSDNRDSFEESDGAGGGTVIIEQTADISKNDITQFSYKAEDLGLIDRLSFEGRKLDSDRKIQIIHNRNRQIVLATLFEAATKISSTNFELKCINTNTIELQVNKPYKSNTLFNVLII